MFDESPLKPIDLTELFEITSEHSKLQDKLEKGGLAKDLMSVDDKLKAKSSQKYLNTLLTELEAYTDKLYGSLNLPTVQTLDANILDLKNKQEKEQLFNKFIDKITDIKTDLVKFLEPTSNKDGLMLAPGSRQSMRTKLQDDFELALHDTDLEFKLPLEDTLESSNTFKQDRVILFIYSEMN